MSTIARRWRSISSGRGFELRDDGRFRQDVYGRDAILRVFDVWEEQWSSLRWEVEEYIDAGGGRVVTLHNVFATGPESGVGGAQARRGDRYP